MLKTKVAFLVLAGFAASATANDLTWRKDIGPMVAAKCGACHGASAPEFNDWMLLGDDKRKTVAPRMDTYPTFMTYVVWPGTGAMMRRLTTARPLAASPAICTSTWERPMRSGPRT